MYDAGGAHRRPACNSLDFFCQTRACSASSCTRQKKKKKPTPPKKTRANKFGRPQKNASSTDKRAIKIAQMKEKIKRRIADGALVVDPEKRRKWNGTVSILLAQYIYVYMRVRIADEEQSLARY